MERTTLTSFDMDESFHCTLCNKGWESLNEFIFHKCGGFDSECHRIEQGKKIVHPTYSSIPTILYSLVKDFETFTYGNI